MVANLKYGKTSNNRKIYTITLVAGDANTNTLQYTDKDGKYKEESLYFGGFESGIGYVNKITRTISTPGYLITEGGKWDYVRIEEVMNNVFPGEILYNSSQGDYAWYYIFK